MLGKKSFKIPDFHHLERLLAKHINGVGPGRDIEHISSRDDGDFSGCN